MKRLLVALILLTGGSAAAAQEKNDVFADLDKKIETQLASDAWHPASQAFIRTQWAEYKKAHQKAGRRGDFNGAKCHGGITCEPEIVEIKQYAGDYRYKPSGETPMTEFHIRIVVTKDQRVFVIQDGARIPAVVNNGIIFFSNGELVKQNAQLGKKPYAKLDIRMVYKAKNFGFVTGSPDEFVDDMLQLAKVEKAKEAEDAITRLKKELEARLIEKLEAELEKKMRGKRIRSPLKETKMDGELESQLKKEMASWLESWQKNRVPDR